LDGEYRGVKYLARKTHHVKGQDVVMVDNARKAFQVQATHDFGVPFIDKVKEFRVWQFHKKTLAVYEKQYQGEGKPQQHVIWNHQDGLFKFVNIDRYEWPKLLRMDLALEALYMDFGAIDVIEDKDGKVWMLEVNSAPMIDGVKRTSGVLLAKEIFKWAEG